MASTPSTSRPCRDSGPRSVRPHIRLDATLVGLVQQSNAVVEDDIDRFPTFVFFTPALGRRVVADGGQDGAITYGLQLDHGNSEVNAVEREFARAAPPGNSYGFHAIAPVEAKVNRTVEPLTIALAVFGGVAALAVLLIGLQLISRQLREVEEESSILRCLGAGPTTIAADSLVGILASIGVGALLAAVVAVALSPLSPLGPVRPVYPDGGIAFDWTVLGLGSSGARRRSWNDGRRPGVSRNTSSGIGALAGFTRASLEGRRGRGLGRSAGTRRDRDALCPRIGARPNRRAGAVGLVGDRLGCGAGGGHPHLREWSAVSGVASCPVRVELQLPAQRQQHDSPQTLPLLNHDPDVVAWAGYDYTVAEIDGQGVPFLFEHGQSATKAPISPPILTGHTFEGKNQIVLGAATLAQLHKRIGDTVVVTYGTPGTPLYVPPIRLVVVGTATMPAVGFSSVIDDHTSMGTGAVMSEAVLPVSFKQAMASSIPALDGPNLIFVRVRPGLAPAVGLASMQRIATAADKVLPPFPDAQGDTVSVLGVQRPAEIVSYRTMGVTPALLTSALAVGAIVALGLTLATSVRRRRRDLPS